MRAVVIVLFLTIVSSFSLSVLQDVETEWSQFKADYGKIYKSIFEEQDRKAIFVENYKLIKEHNKKYELGFETYTLKLNKFADTTSSERKILRGFRKTKKLFNSVKFQPNPLAELPESLNWTSKGVVTRVKNQGDCGSCWAFSATGSVESQYFLKTGKLVELSEQNLIDCSTENNGCYGGFPENAMYYILKNDGIDSEEFYPYKTMNDYCGYDSAYNVTSISGVVAIESGNEEHLKQAVVTIGPISVGIDASSSAFAFYEDGVFNPKQCDNRTLDHAVLVVGYGSEDGREYWLVKNSWSEKWGYNGYIKMIRNNNNHCGIATDAVYPTMY